MATVPKITITTVQVTVNSPPPSGPSSPTRPQSNLHSSTGLTGRHSTPQGSGNDRIRQPIRENPGPPTGRVWTRAPDSPSTSASASPEHEHSVILSGGNNSHRFSTHSLHSSIEINSGNTSLRIETHSQLGVSGRIRNWLAGMAPQGDARPHAAPRFNPPAPGRSWTAVAMSLVGGLKHAAGVVGDQLALTASIVTLPKVKPSLLGALAGHGIHQVVAVGIPTFVREMVAVGVMHALRHAPKHAVVSLQVGVGVANLAIQLGREYRESRNINAAARAYFSLTREEWDAKSPVQRNEMRTHMRKMSRAITSLQVMASMTNVALMMDAFHRGDHMGTLRPVATEIKVGVYAAMRDGLQATFTMVSLQGPPLADGGHGPLAAGMSGAAHGAAAATYAGANFAAAFLSDALMGALVPGRSGALATMISHQATHDATMHAVGTMAMASGVAAAANTMAEITDWFQRMQHFVGQTPGATQSWGPALGGTDYGRLLDQAPARAAAFNAIFSTLGVVGLGLSKTELTPGVQQFIGNAAVGVMIGMLDSPIMGIWQAEEAVRQEPTPAPSTVTITEIPDPEVGIHTPPEPNPEVSSGEISGSAGSGHSASTAAEIPVRHPRT